MSIFLVALFLAVTILVPSILSASTPQYVFSQAPSPAPFLNPQDSVQINYFLPYPGRVAPDDFLWPVKVARDRIWVSLSFNTIKKSESLLTLADKRLASAQKLFEEDKPQLAVAVLTKAEKYLEEAVKTEKRVHKKDPEVIKLLEKLTHATLKHRQVIESLLEKAPEDAKPVIVQTADYPKRLFVSLKSSLMEIGGPTIENPFQD